MMVYSRRERIAAELARHAFLSVEEIAARFECSLATARRDLRALADAGRIQRAHGGAAPLVHEMPAPPEVIPDPYLPEKQRVAHAAAALVRDGDTVGLTGGSTVFELARCLLGRRIGVVTNAVDTALEMAAVPGSRVVLLGGVLDYHWGREMVGPLTEATLAHLHIDTLFTSVNGISAETGISVLGGLEADVMRAMAARARRVVVVTDHSKLGRTALTYLLPISAVSTLVTITDAPSPALEAIRAAGVEVIGA